MIHIMDSYVGIQLLIQFIDLEEVVTWRICTLFHFWSSRIFSEIQSRDSNCSKTRFWSSSNDLFLKKFDWIKIQTTCTCVTWLPLPNLGTGSRVIRYSESGVISKIDQKKHFGSLTGNDWAHLIDLIKILSQAHRFNDWK